MSDLINLKTISLFKKSKYHKNIQLLLTLSYFINLKYFDFLVKKTVEEHNVLPLNNL